MLNSFKELVQIAQKLRGPNGCPWDRSRTLISLEKDFMEEAQEVRQALQKEDFANLKEELGDTLFTIILMSLIAEDDGHFTLKDVFKGIQEKIIRRHTWVFGKDKVSTPEEALVQWKKNKAKEKRKK
ncbi:MAG: tetrapyrrole methyltransferase domain-containing/MazG-like protein domain-containing protein, dITP/XTP pyrophosphatase [Candidatus Peregrinibacteria bacterium GW2011_GWF2_39_17]|nr:MAG: tetrapyrrole methyltransferase domain-containing/MazG-like protein domain-containing protein, dITP/XTP pyrophosphatase [Candidatus Peregrinibacteria bacterium GW2011_GWF2_39_17]HCW32131.1 nucleotide pyrophosphohydrolase [Candidatus Peregrinibacteria bacterium]